MPYCPGAGPGGARSFRSVPRGSFPSLVFRNVYVCCDRKTSEGYMRRAAGFRAHFLPPFVSGNQRALGRGSALRGARTRSRTSRFVRDSGCSTTGGSSSPIYRPAMGRTWEDFAVRAWRQRHRRTPDHLVQVVRPRARGEFQGGGVPVAGAGPRRAGQGGGGV